MQFNHTRTTINGSSEEVARFLELHPLAESMAIDVQSSPLNVPPVTGTLWPDFRMAQTGKIKELLDLLIENRGKMSGEKLKSCLSMTQLQLNALHGTLNGNARKFSGEAGFITTTKIAKTLYYFIRPQLLSRMGDTGGKSVVKRPVEKTSNHHLPVPARAVATRD